MSKISLLEKVSILINFDTLNLIYSILSQEPTDGFKSNQCRFTTERVQNVNDVFGDFDLIFKVTVRLIKSSLSRVLTMIYIFGPEFI